MIDRRQAARQLAGVNGVAEADIQATIDTAAQQNPALLIGGFAIDFLIAGAYVALRVEYDDNHEFLNDDDIRERIQSIIEVAYVGLV